MLKQTGHVWKKPPKGKDYWEDSVKKDVSKIGSECSDTDWHGIWYETNMFGCLV